MIVRTKVPDGVPDDPPPEGGPLVDELPPPPQPMLKTTSATAGNAIASRRRPFNMNASSMVIKPANRIMDQGGAGELGGTIHAEARAVVLTAICTVVLAPVGVTELGDTLHVAAAGAPEHVNVMV